VHPQVPFALGDLGRVGPGLVDRGDDRHDRQGIDGGAQSHRITYRKLQLGSKATLDGHLAHLCFQPGGRSGKRGQQEAS
jgi:hypothetical protein